MESQHDEHFLADHSPLAPDQARLSDVPDSCGAARPKKRRLDARGSFIEGTAVGDGTRLVSSHAFLAIVSHDIFLVIRQHASNKAILRCCASSWTAAISTVCCLLNPGPDWVLHA